ncbi:gamma-glutamylcyclotransferase [Oligoflexia bacterium]|nr:gamma-glutamylcyclotransferase [Oligoflexia bacterium]
MPLYFAYGSNMDLEQMQERCPASKVVSVGVLQDYRLDFTHYATRWNGGVGDVVPEGDATVWGLVFELPEEDLLRLDDFESRPHVYDRCLVNIKIESEVLKDVWVYTIQNRKPFIAPSSRYLNTIKNAAKEWEFPKVYQEFLERIEVCD